MSQKVKMTALASAVLSGLDGIQIALKFFGQ
jgi:hypothetical protein